MVPAAVVLVNTDDAARQVTPQEAWALAPLIAGAPTYRSGRWIGGRFQYPRPQNPPRITASRANTAGGCPHSRSRRLRGHSLP